MIETLKKKKIAVVAGGFDGEREVSFLSAENVMKSLEEKGVHARLLEMNGDFLKEVQAFKPDLIYNSLHGSFGEDGRFQGLLDFLKIPYTGEGHYASALCFNKIYTKRFFFVSNIKTAKAFFFKTENEMEEIALLEKSFSYPFVLKKASSGSTIGVYIIQNQGEFFKKVEETRFRKESLTDYFAEEFLEGKEVTVGVVRHQGKVKVLPILAVRAKKGFLDYEAKYTEGFTEFEIPAKIEKNLEEEIERISREIFIAMSFRQCARIDFIIREGVPHALEVNTSPGNTKTSDIPMMLKSAGIDKGDFYAECLATASYNAL